MQHDCQFQESVLTLIKDVSEIKTCICGNGNKGLKTRIDELEADVAIFNRYKYGFFAIAGFLGCIVGLFFQLFK